MTNLVVTSKDQSGKDSWQISKTPADLWEIFCEGDVSKQRLMSLELMSTTYSKINNGEFRNKLFVDFHQKNLDQDNLIALIALYVSSYAVLKNSEFHHFNQSQNKLNLGFYEYDAREYKKFKAQLHEEVEYKPSTSRFVYFGNYILEQHEKLMNRSAFQAIISSIRTKCPDNLKSDAINHLKTIIMYSLEKGLHNKNMGDNTKNSILMKVLASDLNNNDVKNLFSRRLPAIHRLINISVFLICCVLGVVLIINDIMLLGAMVIMYGLASGFGLTHELLSLLKPFFNLPLVQILSVSITVILLGCAIQSGLQGEMYYLVMQTMIAISINFLRESVFDKEKLVNNYSSFFQSINEKCRLGVNRIKSWSVFSPFTFRGELDKSKNKSKNKSKKLSRGKKDAKAPNANARFQVATPALTGDDGKFKDDGFSL